MSENGSDMETIIDRAAKFIYENGVEYETELLETFPSYTFVIESDHNHGIYQQKLNEYRNGVHDVANDYDHNTEIIQPTPPEIATLIERTAIFVAKKGVKVEEMIRNINVNNERYNFMRRSDPFHAFYQKKLIEYRCQVGDDDTDSDDDGVITAAQEQEARRILSQLIVLPRLLQSCPPPGMTFQEFKTIKLTAQFVAWYGSSFLSGLTVRAIPQLEFVNSTNRWYSCFSKLAAEYSKVFKPPTDLNQELTESPAYTATILDAFLQRLQWDANQNWQWRQEGVRAMIDWHESVTKDFVNKVKNQRQSPPPPPEEPDPKRQKFDDESAFVPEDQFLAQHPGSSTIKVSVPDADGGKIIEITVNSLSESVASLKEKIAGEIANTHKLSGKAGVLKDKNRSLAHYNVGAGDILTLSL